MVRRLVYALFVAYAAATAIHIGFVMAHEPFSFDAWNVTFSTKGEPITASRFARFWWDEYLHSNPRIGQAFTYLAYKVDWFAEVATPLAYLAIATGVTVLGLGRWPWQRARDLALWAIAIGFGWFVYPEIGRNMFCRAYSANYVYAAALILWFLVPLRMAKRYDVSLPVAIAYGGAGFIAGLCNEHTGPALVGGLAVYLWLRRDHGDRPRLLVAGGVGALAGFLALFFSPGQSERYEALASKVSIPVRILRRGVINNLDIVRDYVIYAAPLLLLLAVLVLVADREKLRAPLRLVAIALVAGAVLTVTLFASPRLGSRFYYVSLALLLASVIGVIDAALERDRGRIALLVLAVAASVYAAVRTIPLFARVSRESEVRIAALEQAPIGSTVVVDSFTQVPESWWFIGDDFRAARKRELVAAYLGLSQVLFRDSNALVPLGIGGAQIHARAQTAGEACPREVPLDLDGMQPFDVAGIQRSIATTARQLAASRFEVVVEVPNATLPRPRLVLARAHGGALETYSAVIDRSGVSTEREVKLSPALRGKPFEIYATQIGSESRRLGTTAGEPLRYVPWRTGIYWILACDAAECWIVAAGRNHAL